MPHPLYRAGRTEVALARGGVWTKTGLIKAAYRTTNSASARFFVAVSVPRAKNSVIRHRAKRRVLAALRGIRHSTHGGIFFIEATPLCAEVPLPTIARDLEAALNRGKN